MLWFWCSRPPPSQRRDSSALHLLESGETDDITRKAQERLQRLVDSAEKDEEEEEEEEVEESTELPPPPRPLEMYSVDGMEEFISVTMPPDVPPTTAEAPRRDSGRCGECVPFSFSPFFLSSSQPAGGRLVV